MNGKKVVLYLTSPNSWKRTEMSLNNFKQIQKLGYDIITLSTVDYLPDYFYENSKTVICDYNQHTCDAKHYYEYKKRTGGGYYIWNASSTHQVTFFHKTHFPSLLRNIKTLILFAKSMGYDEYFYCEDDHNFHVDDLLKVNSIFDELKQNDLVIFTFNCTPGVESSKVYCTYFHFGKLNDEVLNIFKNFAYNEHEFITKNKDLYLHFFERVFLNLIHFHKSENLKLKEITDINELFDKSNLNMVYSFRNLEDDSRCNFIYNNITKNNIFYYHTCGIDVDVDLKIFVNEILHYHNVLNPGCWILTEIEDSLINQTKVVLNNKIVKTFKNLNVNDIIYNGELSK